MADIQITYETLFDLLRRERNRDEIQPLDASFYADVLTYMAEKQQLMGSMGDMTAEAEKARIQFQNIKKIIKELYDRREKKLVLLALNTVRTGMTAVDKSGFLPEEQLFFSDLTKNFNTYRRDVLDAVLRQAAPFGGTMPPLTKQPTQTSQPVQKQPTREEKPLLDETKIKFLKPVPRFAGGGEKVFGPFNAGEETSLPTKIAVVLVKKGRADEISYRKGLKRAHCFFIAMKLPKITKRHCTSCGKHTEHKVSLAKRKGRSTAHPLSKGGTTRVQARGLRRGAGNLGRYSKPTKPKMSGKKLSKKTDFRFECTECKKSSSQASGIRAKKVELI